MTNSPAQTHGEGIADGCSLADALGAAEAALAAAEETLTQLRDAWNAHMATCNQDAHLVPTPEQIDRWKNAPSNTASSGLPEKTSNGLTEEQSDFLQLFADGEPRELGGSASLAPARNLIRRNLLTLAPTAGNGYYRITEQGLALSGLPVQEPS